MNKKKLLHIIMSSLTENWYCSDVDKNGKAYAWTDSEIAADTLTEILYDLGCEEFHELNSKRPDYRRDNIVIDGCWRALFTEM